MARLTYLTLMSLDGFVADRQGKFDWAEPDEEVHIFINELARPVGTHLYGRRMYETMAAWDTLDVDGQPRFMRDFAKIWQAADKIVYSKTLKTVSTARTRIERTFEPKAVQGLKAAAPRDMTVSGPTLAAEAFKAGLVDVCQFFVAPILVGEGLRAFPSGARLRLSLQEERQFGSGMVYLCYSASAAADARR
jgi:dihydrofolate reductase